MQKNLIIILFFATMITQLSGHLNQEDTVKSVKNSDAHYQLILLDGNSALCLDGSHAGYYVSKVGDPNKIYVHFQGGGWCGSQGLASTLQNCYQRSKTDLGSSKKYPKTIIENQGIMSANQNNYFKNWTRVFLKYCDGAGHQGTSKNPIKYKDSTLYFRGHNITIQQLNSLDKRLKLFSGATHIVVGGDSAGGLATYLWTNYILDNAKTAKVWSLPDSGIFLDSVNIKTNRQSYKISLSNVMKLSNVQIDPPTPQCVKKYEDSKQNCMLAQNIYMYIRAPMFHLQSLYDNWCIPNILGIDCVNGSSLAKCSQNERSYIEQYHKNVTNLLIQMGNIPNSGYWAPVCSNHVYARWYTFYSQNFRIPANSQYSVVSSVQMWLNNKNQNHKHIDLNLQWPQNKPCSGI